MPNLLPAGIPAPTPLRLRTDPRQRWLGMEYFCSENDRSWNLTDKELIAHAEADLRGTGLIGGETLAEGMVIRVPKAYPFYTGSYNDFDTLRNYFDDISNLFLVGRNGMHRYNNTDHSMTAMTAGNNFVAGITDKSNIRAVNMEDGYPEERRTERAAGSGQGKLADDPRCGDEPRTAGQKGNTEKGRPFGTAFYLQELYFQYRSYLVSSGEVPFSSCSSFSLMPASAPRSPSVGFSTFC